METDEFKEVRRLLALKKHEEPPPGYFSYLPDRVLIKIEHSDLSEHSTWWEWLIARFDARPVLAAAYACAISGLLLMGFRVSQLMQSEMADNSRILETPFARLPDPNTVTPSDFVASHFANPAGLFTPAFDPSPEPLPLERPFPVQKSNLAPAH
jgi:hypothetical protein